MKHSTAYSEAKHAKSTGIEYPFVCENKPSVGHQYAVVHPSIRYIYPFVRTSKDSRAACRGFTLIELMITLVIAALLVTIGVPSIRAVIQNSRLTTQANSTLADLAVARSEAIKRGVSVTICRSQNPTATPPSCNGTSANWASGWVIFIDANNDGAIQSTETILRVREPLEGNNTLNTVQIVPPSTVSSITSWVFTANGQTKLSTTSRVEMRLCDSRGASRGKVVTVNFIGRASSSSPPSGCGTT